MAYTTNPHLPKVRMQAVRLVRAGWSIRRAARYTGFSHGAIINWIKKAPLDGRRVIPTLSSRPHHHPRELNSEIVQAVIDYRMKHQRCAEVLHHLLLRDGYQVSLSSIKRVLRRQGLVRHSPWKKWHTYSPRPIAEKPGILVQIDTIVDGAPDDRLYIYTLLDVCSRWAYALPQERINTHRSLRFIKQAINISPFPFQTLQSDHGSEFSKWLTEKLNEHGLSHRHSRVRTPSDNGHLERFNRTIQEECLNRVPRTVKHYQKEITEYLHFYNTERPHMGLNMKTPMQVVRSY
ncbi:DDE-type integrase/transposase/recombinase [Patescibacteria group bacterium]|nr:DDE-type integrase/transposase/recombinase [Patescibacteria group bacterium]